MGETGSDGERNLRNTMYLIWGGWVAGKHESPCKEKKHLALTDPFFLSLSLSLSPSFFSGDKRSPHTKKEKKIGALHWRKQTKKLINKAYTRRSGERRRRKKKTFPLSRRRKQRSNIKKEWKLWWW